MVKQNKISLVRLNRSLIYETSDRKKISVPLGFKSDGASIPSFAWSIIGHPFGEYLESAVIHDWLYKTDSPRKRADWVLLDAMKAQRVSFWKRRIMYRTVRLFGGIHKFIKKRK